MAGYGRRQRHACDGATSCGGATAVGDAAVALRCAGITCARLEQTYAAVRIHTLLGLRGPKTATLCTRALQRAVLGVKRPLDTL